MKKKLMVIAAIMTAILTAQAEIKLSDDFSDYAIGSDINGASGGTGLWETNEWNIASGAIVVTNGLTFPTLETSGNAVFIESTQLADGASSRIIRTSGWAPSRGADFYYSYLVKVTNRTHAKWSAGSSGFGFKSTDDKNIYMSQISQGDEWSSDKRSSIMVYKEGATYTNNVDVVGNTLLVVVKTVDADAQWDTTFCYMWILNGENAQAIQDARNPGDPISEILLDANNIAKIHDSSDWGGMDAEAPLQIYGARVDAIYDEIRIATTLADALPLQPSPPSGTLIVLQ